MMVPRWPLAAGVCAAMLATFAAAGGQAQIAVSANDGKAVLVNGVNTVPANPAPDTVTILDLTPSPIRVIGELQVPIPLIVDEYLRGTDRRRQDIVYGHAQRSQLLHFLRGH